VAAEEQRERQRCDRAGRKMQRLHLQQQAEEADREEYPADRRVGR